MSETVRICRRVLRELQKTDPKARTGQLWTYIRAEVTKNKDLTDGKDLAAQHNSLGICTSFLESTRQHREILKRYSGRGERSVEDSAKLVGLKVPENTLKQDILQETGSSSTLKP